MSLLNNVLTALRSPRLAIQYVGYELRRLWNDPPILHLWGEVKVGGFSGFSEYLSSKKAVSDEEYQFFRSLDLPDGDIFDVGANLGVVTGLMAHLWPDRIIHAFEPGPSTFRSLQTTVRLNKATASVRLNNLALSDQEGELVFDASPNSRATAKLAIQEDKASSNPDASLIHVPTTALDRYVEDCQTSFIALLKLDVEGYEPLVLEGASQLLTNKRIGIIYFELCPPLLRRAGFDPSTTCHALVDFGYELYRIIDGRPVPARMDQAHEVDLENWVAVAPHLLSSTLGHFHSSAQRVPLPS